MKLKVTTMMITAVMLFLIAQTASAQTAASTKPSGIVPVTGQEATVRTGPRSWVIGTVFGQHNPNHAVTHQDSFDAQKVDQVIRGWVWGRAFGHINACGYITRANLMPMKSSRHSNDCGPAPSHRAENRAYLCRAFAKLTNDQINKGTPVKTRSVTALFANFDNNQPSDELLVIPAHRNVAWRWVTKGVHNGQRYVMVNFIVRQADKSSVYPVGKSLWGYVKINDLEALTHKLGCN
jgi:hypothetical protein